MMIVGVIIIFATYGIWRSDNDLLRGMLIPLALLIVILIGYGAYILYSRPAHARDSIALYQTSTQDAIAKERTKHITDNKVGNTLLRTYPILMLLSVLVLIFVNDPHYKGMAIGFAFLFAAAFIIDSGFVSRSNAFIDFSNRLSYCSPTPTILPWSTMTLQRPSKL